MVLERTARDIVGLVEFSISSHARCFAEFEDGSSGEPNTLHLKARAKTDATRDDQVTDTMILAFSSIVCATQSAANQTLAYFSLIPGNLQGIFLRILTQLKNCTGGTPRAGLPPPKHRKCSNFLR